MYLLYRISIKFVFLFLTLTFISCNSSNQDMEEVIFEEEDDIVIELEETNISWKNWYLSVPINRGNGSATSIFYQDIENNNLTAEQSNYFYKNSEGSYTMYTKFTGFTTSGGPFALDDGKYCRTELREFWRGNQTTSDNWSMSTGTHILESTLEVIYCEGIGQTYIAQIHGIETEGVSGSPATVKVQWKNGDLLIDYYVKPNEGEDWTSKFNKKIIIGKVDNEKFTIKLKVEDGKLFYGLVCETKNIATDYAFVFDYVKNGYLHNNYFKTGNYFKWNKDYEASSEVILHKVATSHM